MKWISIYQWCTLTYQAWVPNDLPWFINITTRACCNIRYLLPKDQKKAGFAKGSCGKSWWLHNSFLHLHWNVAFLHACFFSIMDIGWSIVSLTFVSSNWIPRVLAMYRIAPYLWSSCFLLFTTGRWCRSFQACFKVMGVNVYFKIGAYTWFKALFSRISFSNWSTFWCLKVSLKHRDHIFLLLAQNIGLLRIPLPLKILHL